MYNPDSLLDTFLEGKPRSETWQRLKESLQQRLDALRIERDACDKADPGYDALDRKVKELRQQVAALAEEEAITRFVEDSVLATVARPHPLEAFVDEEDF